MYSNCPSIFSAPIAGRRLIFMFSNLRSVENTASHLETLKIVKLNPPLCKELLYLMPSNPICLQYSAMICDGIWSSGLFVGDENSNCKKPKSHSWILFSFFESKSISTAKFVIFNCSFTLIPDTLTALDNRGRTSKTAVVGLSAMYRYRMNLGFERPSLINDGFGGT